MGGMTARKLSEMIGPAPHLYDSRASGSTAGVSLGSTGRLSHDFASRAPGAAFYVVPPHSSQLLDDISPRFSIPRPAGTASQAYVAPASPRMLPCSMRTTRTLQDLKYGSYQRGVLSPVHNRRNDPNLDRLIKKCTSFCSCCGALGHRMHLDWCRYATSGSQSSTGFTPCYKTR